MVPLFDLTRQYQSLKTELDAAVLDLLASGQYVMGPAVENFEAAAAQELGVKHAIGVANGKTELSSNIVVIGFDSGAAQKGMITSGVMAGAITQNPVGIGYETVAAAVKALKGETLPPVIDTGFYYYDAATMADPEIAAVLYD